MTNKAKALPQAEAYQDTIKYTQQIINHALPNWQRTLLNSSVNLQLPGTEFVHLLVNQFIKVFYLWITSFQVHFNCKGTAWQNIKSKSHMFYFKLMYFFIAALTPLFRGKWWRQKLYKVAFIVCCNAAAAPMYRLLIYRSSTQHTAPQVHFLAVPQCSSRRRDGNTTTATYRNAAAVDYERSLSQDMIHTNKQ